MDVRIYLYITLVVRNIYCSEYDQFYAKSIDWNDRKFTNTLLKNETESSKIHCAGLCNITPGCQDFKVSQDICYLYGVNDNSQPVQNITTRFKKANFTAATLPSGVTFTYALVLDNKLAMDVADECSLLGGRVLMINSVEKRDYIRSVIIEHKDLLEEWYLYDFIIELDFWVDGSRMYYNPQADLRDDWKFVNGESMPLDVWSPGYPDGTGILQCVQLRHQIDYYLDDRYCDIELNFICEK